jgi:hypothetical protein
LVIVKVAYSLSVTRLVAHGSATWWISAVTAVSPRLRCGLPGKLVAKHAAQQLPCSRVEVTELLAQLDLLNLS